VCLRVSEREIEIVDVRVCERDGERTIQIIKILSLKQGFSNCVHFWIARKCLIERYLIISLINSLFVIRK